MNIDKTIWLTGASSGIGYAFALLAAKHDYHLIISGRNEAKLQQLKTEIAIFNAPLKVDILAFDLNDYLNEQSTAILATKLQALCSNLDAIVLNAGDCFYMDGAQPDLDRVKQQFNVNFFANIACFNAARSLLKPDGSSEFIVVSSLVTELALPRSEYYGASKAALNYFFETLAIDTDGLCKIKIAQPGFVKTPLTDKNDFDMPFLIEADEAAQHLLKLLHSDKARARFPKRLAASLKMAALLTHKSWRKRAQALRRQGGAS